MPARPRLEDRDATAHLFSPLPRGSVALAGGLLLALPGWTADATGSTVKIGLCGTWIWKLAARVVEKTNR
jgi:hypothetical protein